METIMQRIINNAIDPQKIPQKIGAIINSPRNNELRYANALEAKQLVPSNSNSKLVDNVQKIKEYSL